MKAWGFSAASFHPEQLLKLNAAERQDVAWRVADLDFAATIHGNCTIEVAPGIHGGDSAEGRTRLPETLRVWRKAVNMR